MDADGGSSSTARTGGGGAGAGEQQPQRSSWRPRLVAFSAPTSSSTSGGSFSTTYTSGSSYLESSSGDGGLAPPVALLSTWLDLEEGREETEACRHIRGLVQEFTVATGDDEATAHVLDRCLSDLGVSWVLSIATDDRSSAVNFNFPQRLGDLSRSWIDALSVIQLSISAYMNESCNQEEGALSSVSAASEFARFLGSTFLKMLPFADAVVSAKVNDACIQHNLWEPMLAAEEKLQALIGVRRALSQASECLQMSSLCQSFQGSVGIIKQTSSLLSAKLAKFDEAVCDTVDEFCTSILSLEANHNEADSMDPQTLGRSLDIHRATRSTVNCINVLCQIVLKAPSKYVVHLDKSHIIIADPSTIMIMDMISCLQENLARVSQPFSDQSLRFLFLLNNIHFIWKQLHSPNRYGCELYMEALARKIGEHIQGYLQASWIPVVSGLQDPMPLCLGRYSPLAKFETEFQKTYAVQKLWKVPDPDLRRRLRKAIIETVIPAFTKYLEDNKITATRVTRHELEGMLQDLFEG